MGFQVNGNKQIWIGKEVAQNEATTANKQATKLDIFTEYNKSQVLDKDLELDFYKNNNTNKTEESKQAEATKETKSKKKTGFVSEESIRQVPPKKDPRPPVKQDLNPPAKVKKERLDDIQTILETKLPEDTSYTTNSLVYNSETETAEFEHPNRTRRVGQCTVTYSKDGSPIQAKFDDGSFYILAGDNFIEVTDDSFISRENNGKLSGYTNIKHPADGSTLVTHRDGKGKLTGYERHTQTESGIKKEVSRDGNGNLIGYTITDDSTRGQKLEDGSYSGSKVEEFDKDGNKKTDE